MLVELGLVEQRYQAVREVLDHGASVTDVARRNGVGRQAVHEWLVKYANHGLAGLVDRSSTPQSCPYQMSPMVEGAHRRAAPGASRPGAPHRVYVVPDDTNAMEGDGFRQQDPTSW